MEKLDNQALTRFERLWKIEGDKLLRANIIPSAVKDGEIYPVDYCISTIARLIHGPAFRSLWYQKCIIEYDNDCSLLSG